METIVPTSISELKLFIKATHIEGLRQFFAINEPLVSTYHDDYQGLELEAFDLDDPILKLLIVKKTQQPLFPKTDGLNRYISSSSSPMIGSTHL